MDRTKFVIRNVFSGFGSKIISLLLGFASRTVFIMFLGNAYLGVNGLFTNILSVLSFAELGFGVALNFAMYKPIADNNSELIIQLLNYYKKIYKIIVTIIIVVGCALIPAIPYLVKGADQITSSELMVFYSLNLFNTVISYFISYKVTYVNACQKGYIITMYDTIINSIIVIAQIIVISTAKLYLAYVITQTILLLLSKIGLNFYINKKFPIVKEKPEIALAQEEKKEIKTNVKGLVMHQFASIAVFCTDNIIISSMVSVVIVGMVSNYNMIITNVVGFLNILFGSFTATLGNIYAKESKEIFYMHFKRINFIGFWLQSFCHIAFFVLIPPFINLWIGEGNLINLPSFILLIVCSCILGLYRVFGDARGVVGKFNVDKWLAVGEAIVNLIVSVVGAKYLGLFGVYLGTLCARLFYLFTRPATTYKLMFNVSPINYYIKIFFQFLTFVIATVITYFATQYVLSIKHWGYFILGTIITVLVANIVLLLLTFWTNDFKNTVQYVYQHLFKRKVKKPNVESSQNNEISIQQENETIELNGNIDANSNQNELLENANAEAFANNSVKDEVAEDANHTKPSDKLNNIS